MGPNDKVLTEDEETVEILEIIENCDEYCDSDDDDGYEEYVPEY